MASWRKRSLTPLESPSISACPQTGMLGMVEIPAKAGASAPYGGRGQSPALSNGVYSFYVFRSSGATTHFME
jgi:hypothetical protein